MAWLCVLAVLLQAAVARGHQGPPDTHHASPGHLLLLKCPISGVHSNVTWTREAASAGAKVSLPPGVEVRDGFLWFLPMQTTHNGTYSCQSAEVQSRTVKIDFRVLVSTGLCPPAAEVRSISLGATQSLPCKLDHVLRLNNMSNVRWLKDCHPVEREGAPVSVHDGGFIRLHKATREDAGTYTCLVNVSLGGRMYTSARSIQLRINDMLTQTVLIKPEVIQHQQQQTVTVDIGARVELKCLAFVGFSQDQETFMFWVVNGSFVDDDPELQESFRITPDQGRVFGESTLTISRVLPRFLNVSIRCRVQSPRDVKDCLVHLREANHSWFHAGVAVGSASLLLLLLALLLAFFKVDVALASRKLRGYFVTPQDADWVPYDALVSVVHGSGSETGPSVASDFALQLLPSRLEEQHGYRLFIAGRDDSPGEARHDTMAAAIQRCRRLIIVVESETDDEEEEEKKEEKKEACEWRPLSHDDRQLSYEQKLGLHDALTHNTPAVILLEIDGPPDYRHLPQSLGFIKRRQGALTWRKHKRNRVFWKKLRFLMPAVPAARQSRLRPDHIL
ncbi:interleukin-1 receptor type 1 [Syngnathoides biaculeatus]|uniref:interleukin-1 receptor type 1 n=1 Tax=Syngnathoides biaculeatus TaxID=300417 RepID=UPI002ADDA15B|nr:interleukin-1 receptor type 1 [Syngnathoides biaculeatus]